MTNVDSGTSWIGWHPNDGRQYENQCARCGSSLYFVECDNCGGEGLSGHDCGEDTCCCLDPEDNEDCDWCNGKGGHWACLSSADWCRANPREGRDHVTSGTPEWFVIRELSPAEASQALAHVVDRVAEKVGAKR